MTALDQWWLRQFRRHFAMERAGRDPKTLLYRWLVLSLHASHRKRWGVSFEIPHQVHHFLDDADIRSKDRKYAESQWQIASEWLNG